MKKLRITHIDVGQPDTWFFLRFAGDSMLFHQMCDELKALGWHTAHWDPNHEWSDGKLGAWYVKGDALLDLARFFLNLLSAMQTARDKREEADYEGYWKEQEYQYRAQSGNNSHTRSTQRNAPAHITEAYRALNLSTTTDREVIKRAYRQLAILHHPDKHALADVATRQRHEGMLKKVNHARDIILKWLEVPTYV